MTLEARLVLKMCNMWPMEAFHSKLHISVVISGKTANNLFHQIKIHAACNLIVTASLKRTEVACV